MRDSYSITYKGLTYKMDESSFLNREEAFYGLKQFWNILAGTAEWDHDPIVEISSISPKKVDDLFSLPDGALKWVSTEVLGPAGKSGIFDDSIPLLCLADEDYLVHEGEKLTCGIDVVAATFISLTRYEEYFYNSNPDQHGRFQIEDSIAWKQGFHDRPIIDQWAMILRSWIEHLRPSWNARLVNYTPFFTHDMDVPIKFSSPWYVLRASLGELLVRSRSPIKALSEFWTGLKALFFVDCDPYYRKTKSMLVREKSLGFQSACFYMSAGPGMFDRGYNVLSSRIQRSIEFARSSGVVLGWHPGYKTLDGGEQFYREKEKIDTAISGIIGGRQHYLRWVAGQSWELWDQAGLRYDSSLGWANNIGFRSGTCHPYTTFSIRMQKELALIERPLLVMDNALGVLAESRCDWEKELEMLFFRVGEVGGEPVVLLHNSYSRDDIHEAIYTGIKSIQNGSSY